MQRATGFGKPLPVPWRQRIRSGPPDAGFAARPVRQSGQGRPRGPPCRQWRHRVSAGTDRRLLYLRRSRSRRAEHDPDFGDRGASRSAPERPDWVRRVEGAEATPDTIQLGPDERNPRASSSSEGSGSVSTGSTSQTASTSTGSSASGGGCHAGLYRLRVWLHQLRFGLFGLGGGDPDSDSGSGGPGGGGGETGGGGSGGGSSGGSGGGDTGGGGGGGGGGLVSVVDQLVDLISG